MIKIHTFQSSFRHTSLSCSYPYSTHTRGFATKQTSNRELSNRAWETSSTKGRYSDTSRYSAPPRLKNPNQSKDQPPTYPVYSPRKPSHFPSHNNFPTSSSYPLPSAKKSFIHRRPILTLVLCLVLGASYFAYQFIHGLYLFRQKIKRWTQGGIEDDEWEKLSLRHLNLTEANSESSKSSENS